MWRLFRFEGKFETYISFFYRFDMKMNRLCIVCLFVFSGCVSSQMEQRIKRLENSVNDMRGFQAEQTAQIQSMQQDMRKLTGKTEEIEYAANKRMGTDLDSLKADLSTLKRRVPPPANVPVQPLEEDEAIATRAGMAEFTDALTMLRSGSYAEALTMLQPIMQTIPTDYVPNVLFWVGVAYDGMAENKNALATYHDLVTQFPRHRRAPLALIRQASIFEKIGDGRAAELTMQKLVNDYPDTPEALQVKKRMVPSAPAAKAAPKAPPPSKPVKKSR